MQTPEAIRARRAVKHYDPEHRFSDEEFAQLMDLALQAPTSFNIQNWRFVRVADPALRQELRAAAFDQAQVTDASLLFVLCADLESWQKEPQRYWRDAPPEVAEMLLGMLAGFYEGKDQLKRDEAMRSVGIVAQTLMLAAKDMGYDSCPMIGFDAEKVAELIGLPDDHAVGMMLTIGKGTRPAWPKPGQLALDEVLVTDRFA